jgi:3-oxoacyl-[acyl-carrier protein] reductase
MDLGLKDQVALVTAASKGLGKAAALAFAQEGAKVSVCARSDELERTAEEIGSKTGADILSVRADVTKVEEIQNLVQRTLDEYQKIDILIVNAGGPPPGNFMDLNPGDWREAVDLTIMSAVELCYAVVPHMLERGSGSIVTTQSVSVKQPIDNLILSNSLRMAVIGMMKSMANELGSHGIRVNSINPSYTYTERVQHLLEDRAARNNISVEEQRARASAIIPLRRMATVEEYGKAIVWLASPAASFIHGHALMFDGGTAQSPL